MTNQLYQAEQFRKNIVMNGEDDSQSRMRHQMASPVQNVALRPYRFPIEVFELYRDATWMLKRKAETSCSFKSNEKLGWRNKERK